MLAFESAMEMGRKTLVIDLDPCGNASRILTRTGNLEEITYTITNAFQEGILKPAITNIIGNLDLVAANASFRNIAKILMTKYPNEYDQINYLNVLLTPIKEKYDAIYINVPTTVQDFNDNAMLAADYCILVLPMHREPLTSIQNYITYMKYLEDTYNNNMQVLGIIPCILQSGGKVNGKILLHANKLYGGKVLDTVVKYQERLKEYDVEGVKSSQNYTDEVNTQNIKEHKIFIDILNELDWQRDILKNNQEC
ncbi:ParA family protein [Enterococcus faecalis]|uniref:ParA family protein n=1 Tax=Enterococcus faecalis TaxID=1351 RepID=UPI0025B09ADB|nr:ParA family protein [Enterococcus faecalis]MDN3202159.1 ParA family protein [Enterococcus faecalis]